MYMESVPRISRLILSRADIINSFRPLFQVLKESVPRFPLVVIIISDKRIFDLDFTIIFNMEVNESCPGSSGKSIPFPEFLQKKKKLLKSRLDIGRSEEQENIHLIEITLNKEYLADWSWVLLYMTKIVKYLDLDRGRYI